MLLRVQSSTPDQESAYLSSMQASQYFPGPTISKYSSSEGYMLTMPAVQSNVGLYSKAAVERQPKMHRC